MTSAGGVRDTCRGVLLVWSRPHASDGCVRSEVGSAIKHRAGLRTRIRWNAPDADDEKSGDDDGVME